MNRYPLWKYALLVVALLVGLIYTLPNLFGEAPAVQVSSAKVTVKVDDAIRQRVEQAIQQVGVTPDFVHLEAGSVRARFHDTDAQIKAKDAIAKALNGNETSDPTFIVALNLVSRSPDWLTSLHAFPMYLGLDLRGGVHFLMQVDMKGALTKKADSHAGDVRSLLRDKNIRHGGISREGTDVIVRFRDRAVLQQARLNRDRIKTFFDRGISSRTDLDNAEAALEVTEGQHQDALEEIRNRQGLLAQRRSELELARQQLQDTVLRSPISGAVRERQVTIGEYRATGTPISRAFSLSCR